MRSVPIEKLNEIIDEYRDCALMQGKPAEMWLALANLVGSYEENNEQG